MSNTLYSNNLYYSLYAYGKWCLQSKHTYFIDKEKLDKYLPSAIKKAKENINHLKSQYLYISWNKQKMKFIKKILFT